MKLPSRAPRVQAQRKALWNEARSPASADFFTFGYSGRTATEIVSLAKSVGVRSILDIRFNPVSMYKPELSKSNFRRILDAAGLLYDHFPDLGVPRHIRERAIKTGSRDTIWEWYDKIVIPKVTLNWFFNVAEHPVAFMCVEADPEECHRHRVFQALEDRKLRGFDL